MKRPLRNLLSLGLGDAGSRLIGFLVTVYLARVLEPSGFGAMNIGLSVLAYLSLAGSPGIQTLEARNVAAQSGTDRVRVGSVISLRFILGIALWVVTLAVCVMFVEDVVIRVQIILFAASLLPLAFLLDWLFQGKEKMLAIGVAQLANYVVYGLLVFFLVHSVTDIAFIPIAFAVGNSIAAAILWMRFRHSFGNVKLVWNPAVWIDIARKGIPVGGAMFLAQSATNLPPIVLALFLGTAEVGEYSAAMKFIFLFLLLDRIFNALFLPTITRFLTSKRTEAADLVALTLKLMLIVILPLVVLGVVLAPDAISLVFGSRYSDGVFPLRILMGYFAFTILSSIFVCTLLGAGEEIAYAKMIMVSTSILSASVLLFTFLFGLSGAALGVLTGELSVFVLMVISSRKLIKISLLKVSLRPLIAVAVMSVVAFVFRDTGTNLCVIFSMVSFAAVIILTGGVTKNDIRYLRERFV